MRLLATEVVDGHVELSGRTIYQGREALREGAAAAVLPGQADVDALTQQGAQGDHLAGRPVDPTLANVLGTTRHLRGNLGMGVEGLRQVLMSPGDGLQGVGLDRGQMQATVLDRVVRNAAVGLGPRGGLTDLLENRLEARPELRHHGMGVLVGDVTTTDEALGVELSGRTLLSDEVVHVWLGEAGIVTLIVAAAAVADHVDDDVTVEDLAILVGNTSSVDHRGGVISIDVQDRGPNGLGNVGAVGRGTSVTGRGGESDLVVDDDVDRATGAVSLELAHLQGLVDDTLTREGSITMHEDWQDREVVRVAQSVEFGPADALEDRIDGFEVTRVGGNRRLDGVAGGCGELTLVTEVVLDVTRSLGVHRLGIALELTEDLPVGLADDVGQHVETTTVRHADADLVEAVVGSQVAQCGQQDDGRLATLEAEPLLTDELGLQEGLEDLGLIELVEDLQVHLAGEGLVLLLETILEPLALLVVSDVHVLDAHRRGVGVTQDREDLTQGHDGATLPGEVRDREGAVHVPQGEAVAVEHEVVVEPRPVLDGIDVGGQMAEATPGVDEFDDASLFADLVGAVGLTVARPLDRSVGDTQGFENVLVEAISTQEQLVHATQEFAGLGALDDAVIVGRGEGRHLGDAQLRHTGGGVALVGSWVVDRSDAEDHALTRHEAGNGVVGAETAGVRQGGRDSLEVLDGQLIGATLADDLFVGTPEVEEVHLLGALDGGHHEFAGAVLVDDVYGHAEVDLMVLDEVRLAVDLRIGVVHRRNGLECLHHRIGEDVGEGDLAALGLAKEVVDHCALLDDELHRHVTHRGGRRHGQRLIHVLGGAHRRTLHLRHRGLDGFQLGAVTRGVSRQKRTGRLAGGL